MFKRNSFLFVLFFVGLFFVQKVFAVNVSVRINELAWMGTEVSSNDEWIELYNESGEKIDLAGWVLEARDGSPKILLEGSVDAGGYFLLERTDDDSVGGVMADQIYSGALSNSGEFLLLKNQNGDIVDRVEAGGGWFAGDKNLKLTMERKNDEIWQNSVQSGGTPKFGNSEGFVNMVDDDEDDEKVFSLENDVSIQEKAEKLGYDYGNTIVISEIFPSPFGGHSDLEYIELYNYGTEDIDLFAWKIGDKSVMKYELKNRDDDLVIPAGGFFVVYRSESGIALNNSGDTVKLYQPFFDVPFIELKYGSASKGISFGIVDFDLEKLELGLFEHEWSKVLTPNKVNFFQKKNSLPLVDFYCPDEIMIATPQVFDSSDTVDADGDMLKFFWNFGDGATNTLAIPEHTFFKEGEFEVVFSVFDGEDSVVKKKIIKVIDDSRPANQKAIQIADKKTDKASDEKRNQVKSEDVLFDGFEKKEEYVFDLESRVTILGIVAVLPGVLGSQFFYVLENEESAVGIQVYSYKKDFPPALNVGDLIEVMGEIVETKGEKRIKTKGRDDMRILSSGHNVFSQEMIIKEVGDEHIGNLITVAGEVVEQKSTYAYVDDGSDELKIYIKKTSGFSAKIFKEEMEVAVTGILSKTTSGFRLMPRSENDVIFFEEELEIFDEFDDEGKVLGEVSKKNEWYVESRNQKIELFRYLLVICGAVIVILSVLLFRTSKNL